MPTERIGDYPDSNAWTMPGGRMKRCHDPDHNLPTDQHLAPGIYRHTCPTCGRQREFTVHPVMRAGYPLDFELESP